ncbi:MAG: efflux RND transporter periplasmic adaptor subunit [Pseudomonadota bacterium]
MSTRLLLTPLIVVSFCGCEQAAWTDVAPVDAHGEEQRLVFTNYTDYTELFVEFAALVVDQESRFAAHVTELSDHAPLLKGQLDVVLERDRQPVARFRVREPSRPGIFTPSVTPRDAGEFDLVIEVDYDSRKARHELGSITVFDKRSDVVVRQPQSVGDIGFLKEQQWQGQFGTTVATAKPLRQSVPGFAVVEAPDDAGAEIRAPEDGYFSSAKLTRAGSSVDTGDMLGYLIPRLGEDEDFGSLSVEFETAQADYEIALKDVERFKRLMETGAISERQLAEALRDVNVASAEVEAARARVDQYQRGSEAAGIGVRTPVAGTVIESNVHVGSYVSEGDRLFRISAPERRWLEVRVPERYADNLAQTSGVSLTAVDGSSVTLDASNGARVVQVDGAIEPRSRTSRVVIEYETETGPSTIGSRFAVNVFITAPQERLAVPRTALIEDGGRMVVYEQTGGELFLRRPVRLGITDGPLVEIVEGLSGGERIVSDGAYLIRLASAGGDDIGHGHAH